MLALSSAPSITARPRVATAAAASAIVVGSDHEIVDALVAAGITDVVLVRSYEAFRRAARRGGPRSVVFVDAHSRPDALQTVCREPGLLAGRTVVIRGGMLDAEEQLLVQQAGAIVWCSASLGAFALARLAQLHGGG